MRKDLTNNSELKSTEPRVKNQEPDISHDDLR